MLSYKHEPFTDFSKEENKKAMADGYKVVEAYLGEEFPLIVGGERITTEGKIVSYNPANKEQVVGSFQKLHKKLQQKH